VTRRGWPLLIVAVAMPVVVLFALLPMRADGAGTLRECYWGDPVVALDVGAEHDLPVARWPDGLAFNHDRHAVIDGSGREVAHAGDRIVVTGSIVDVHGDPSPCFQTRGIRVESLLVVSSSPVANPS
jgi:hypothetical protein